MRGGRQGRVVTKCAGIFLIFLYEFGFGTAMQLNDAKKYGLKKISLDGS
jgi:hypothetical protein